MSRTSMTAFGVLLVVFILGIGYFVAYDPPKGLRVQCTESFSRLDARNDDMLLSYDEFKEYREGLSPQDYERADADNNHSLTVQEFCNWVDPATQKG